MRDAYSHEVISHGFWPGNETMPEPVLYAYAVPEPAGLKQSRVEPDAAFYHTGLNEFVLPYESVRAAASPEQALEWIREAAQAFVEIMIEDGEQIPQDERLVEVLDGPAVSVVT